MLAKQRQQQAVLRALGTRGGRSAGNEARAADAQGYHLLSCAPGMSRLRDTVSGAQVLLIIAHAFWLKTSRDAKMRSKLLRFLPLS